MDSLDRLRLDKLYDDWNRPEYISPDPIETLSGYADTADREIVGLVAAALAYGRVNSILPSVRRVLEVLGAAPREYITSRDEGRIAADLRGIVHRFARPAHIAALLSGAAAVIREAGSLEEGFLDGYHRVKRTTGKRVGCSSVENPDGQTDPSREPAVAGMIGLTDAIRSGAVGDPGHLLPRPEKGSACKRLFLWLRWMTRRDSVDPGGWDRVNPASLVVPLDTWLHRISLRAGWTARRSPDLKTALEVTAALRKIRPDDPCRYDFALTRFGIRSELNLDGLFIPRRR